VGPALAGVVISIGGYAWAEAANSLSFLAVIAVLLTLRLPGPSGDLEEQLWRSVVDGLHFVRREPGLRVNAVAMIVNTALAAPFIALVPAMAENVLHEGKVGTSILVTAQGIGAVTMAVSLGALAQQWGPRRVLVRMMAGLPPALALYALAPTLATSALALLVVGALYLGALSTFTTIAQLRAPASIRGRVVAVYMVILGSLYPIGSIVQGKVADHIGLRATTFGAAAIMAVVLVAARVVRPGMTAPIDAPVDAPVG
jgi:predicted MFS family arabinose efflux permease